MNFKIIFAAAALLATQSFAIAGIGAHYTPAVGTSLNEAKKSEIFKGQDKLQFSHGNFDYIQGFGFKAWVDLLPFIDIEGTFNIQFASYNASLWAMRDDGTFKEIPMEIELGGTPFAKATPKYIAMNADISVTYPFSIPLFPIRPYVGGGLTMHWNTFVLNKAFVANVIKTRLSTTPRTKASPRALASTCSPVSASSSRSSRLQHTLTSSATSVATTTTISMQVTLHSNSVAVSHFNPSNFVYSIIG